VGVHISIVGVHSIVGSIVGLLTVYQLVDEGHKLIIANLKLRKLG
jgi:hypothetical protein